jgi:hypothetical protein
MGYYIETGEILNKVKDICKMYNAINIPRPKDFNEIPEDKALICVVDNILFEAACFCYNENEFKAFTNIDDLRRRSWLLMDRKLAEKLTNFKNK